MKYVPHIYIRAKIVTEGYVREANRLCQCQLMHFVHTVLKELSRTFNSLFQGPKQFSSTFQTLKNDQL